MLPDTLGSVYGVRVVFYYQLETTKSHLRGETQLMDCLAQIDLWADMLWGSILIVN